MAYPIGYIYERGKYLMFFDNRISALQVRSQRYKRDSISARTDGDKHCRRIMTRSVPRLGRIIS